MIVKLKNGANFEELANKYSLDKNPEMETGGDLGYFRKDMMIPEFGNAAFAMKVGKFSEKPVKHHSVGTLSKLKINVKLLHRQWLKCKNTLQLSLLK